ncbi:MAG: hypothetical protein COV46_08200 [Deltaproteobacteria bacterium CG11_big_fil_rev_8_21_14_0_20_49_13]|nr:MAG: hypothetical protein COV46_08200 [Deltaproteobacteria bacterium CG11_big_fil_rev_8_21_14_0_20_49_13]
MKSKIKEQFLTEAKGHKRAVVIDIDSYNDLMEDVFDLRTVAERKNNPKCPSTHFILKLKKWHLISFSLIMM